MQLVLLEKNRFIVWRLASRNMTLSYSDLVYKINVYSKVSEFWVLQKLISLYITEISNQMSLQFFLLDVNKNAFLLTTINVCLKHPIT